MWDKNLSWSDNIYAELNVLTRQNTQSYHLN